MLRWEHPATRSWNGSSLAGVTDAEGRLYWAECPPAPCQLRGAELDGQLRFTVQVEELERMMVFGRAPQQRLLLVTHSGRLEVRSLIDGSLEWELDLAPSAELHAAPSPQVPTPPIWLMGFHAVATESQAWISMSLLSPIWFTNEVEHRGEALVAIDLERHRVLWTKGADAGWGSLVLDEAGHFHAMEDGRLVSYEEDGGARYRGDSIEQGVWGTVGPSLLVDQELRSSADGSLVRRLFQTDDPSYLVASARSLWRTEGDSVERISLVDGRLEWRAQAGARVQSVQLRLTRLSEDRVLVNAMDDSDGGALPLAVGFDSLGNRWSCGFPGLARGGVIAIADGLIYVSGTTCDTCSQGSLRAYEVPGVAPASDGWAHHDGDFSRSRGDTW